MNKIAFLLLLPLFAYTNDQIQKDYDYKYPSAGKQAISIRIESIRNEIKSSGWQDSLLDIYKSYLSNNKIDYSNEINILNKLPGNFQTDYLKSLVLKMGNRYNDMFILLSRDISQNPAYLPYYDDLVFAAFACGKDSVITKTVISNNIISYQNKSYLQALINSFMGNYNEAMTFYKKALPYYKKNKYFLYNLSYAYRNLDDYPAALGVIQDALKNSTGDYYFTAKANLAAGSLYFLSGDYKAAEEFYKKANSFSTKISDKIDEAVSLVDLGIMEDQNGNFAAARENYLKAAGISLEYGDIETNALAYSELGVSYSLTGDLLKAKDSYKKSYSMYKMLGRKLRLSLLSDNLARLYMQEFNYDKAIKLYKEGLTYAGENKRARAINLIGLGDAHSNLADYSKALEYYNMAKKASAGIKDISLEMETRLGIGSVNYNLGNYLTAYKEFNNSLELCIQSKNIYSISDIYQKMGLVFAQLDSTGKAMDSFTSSITLSTKYSIPYLKALSLIDLAGLKLNQNNIIGIEKLLGEAKTISKENSFYYLTAAAGILSGRVKEKLLHYKDAGKEFSDALKIADKLNEPNIRIELDYLLAGLNEKMSMYDSAAKYYSAAINIIDRISYSLYSKDEVQIEYFAGKDDVYKAYINMLLSEKKYAKAFEILDHSRSRNTLQNLVNLKIGSIITDKEIAEKLYDYEWKLNSGFYELPAIDSIKTEYHKFKEMIEAKFPGIEDYLSQINLKTLSDIQRNISSNEYFISFYTSGENTFVFLIGRNEFNTFKENITEEDLIKAVHKISPYFNSNSENENIMNNKDLFSFNSISSNTLYKEILKDVLNSIPKGNKIIFSLSPELVIVPMEFLVTDLSRSGSPYDYKNNKYLIEDYQISYTPSIDLYIKEKLNNLKNDGKVLLVGNPKFKESMPGYAVNRGGIEEDGGLQRNIPLLPLKYSGNELSEISSLIKVNKILTGGNANEANFIKEAPLSSVIHISTHSLLLKMRPVIFLSNFDNRDNGLIEMNDIVKLKLNSDMITLSSCSSGLGRIDESEGIIGMVKAFYEAGAKSVVVSLWQVDDKYTADFMTLFYKNLSDGMDKSEALRQAKIRFIKNYSANPYYWSAFVLSGNTSEINIKRNTSLNKYLLSAAITLLAVMLICYLRFYYYPGKNNAARRAKIS